MSGAKVTGLINQYQVDWATGISHNMPCDSEGIALRIIRWAWGVKAFRTRCTVSKDLGPLLEPPNILALVIMNDTGSVSHIVDYTET
ncbi:hypothetical protein GCM10025859_14620 [Alicyclobacillus fastidiosus]|nr:hypothetical protein GCM10025859_14620 [Alicyclobacillus fastidiosus]